MGNQSPRVDSANESVNIFFITHNNTVSGDNENVWQEGGETSVGREVGGTRNRSGFWLKLGIPLTLLLFFVGQSYCPFSVENLKQETDTRDIQQTASPIEGGK